MTSVLIANPPADERPALRWDKSSHFLIKDARRHNRARIRPTIVAVIGHKY